MADRDTIEVTFAACITAVVLSAGWGFMVGYFTARWS
jgi:hypothetical protein